MKATEWLHDNGQSIWLDNITRTLLDGGTLEQYIEDLSVTGLTSNPTIFDRAIRNNTAYDGAVCEALFFELAFKDMTRAAELFQPIHKKTNGTDGWVSLPVSPPLAHDTDRTLAAAKHLFDQGPDNLFTKIPGRQGA